MQGLLVLCTALVLAVGVIGDDEISDPFYTREKRDVSIQDKINRKLIIVTIQSPLTNITKGSRGTEFVGFIPDLIFVLSRRLRFQYEFREVSDGKYGTFNGTTWSGMIGELIKNEKTNGSDGADIAAADITITRARERAVDFVKPFKNLGLTVLVKKPHMSNDASGNMWPFEFGVLDPLKPEVWILVTVSVIAVGLVLWGMNKFNPYEWGGRYNLGLANEHQAQSFNLAGSLWFVFTSLQWQGFERAPRSIAAKLLTCVWFGFVTLVLVTYIGSLMNHLYWASMVHGKDPTKHQHNSLADVVNDGSWKYGTVRGGSTYTYLTKTARGMEFDRIKLYWESKEGQDQLVNSVEEGYKKVREDDKYAFIMESMAALHEANKRPCDVMTIGEHFALRSYGLAIPRNSPILEELHHAVLEMQENGDMELLERRWFIDRGECWNVTFVEKIISQVAGLQVNKPKRVSLHMFWGPLVLIVLGVIGSILVAIGEILFYKYKGRYLQSNRPQGQVLKLDPDEGNI